MKTDNTMMVREIIINGITDYLKRSASDLDLMSAYNRYFESREIMYMDRLEKAVSRLPFPGVLDWVCNNKFCSLDKFVCIDYENCDIYSSNDLMELVGEDEVYNIAMDAVDCCECDIPSEEVRYLEKIMRDILG